MRGRRRQESRSHEDVAACRGENRRQKKTRHATGGNWAIEGIKGNRRPRISMGRKTPQNRDAATAARRARDLYGTQKAAARALNISVSTLRKIEKGTGRVRDTTAAKMTTAMSIDSMATITIDELLGIQDYYESKAGPLTPRERQSLRSATKTLEKAEEEGVDVTGSVIRPKLHRGGAEWRLGRGRDEASRKAWETKMRKKGFKGDLQSLYDEATGYTRF